MKTVRKRKAVFTKWLLSYLVILFIPLTAICINHIYSSHVISEERYQSHELIAENLGKSVDECLKEMYVLHNNLYLDDTVRSLRSYDEKSGHFYYDAMLVKNRLSTFTKYQSDISAFIYFPQLEYVFDMKVGNDVKSYYNVYRMGKSKMCDYDTWIEKLSGSYRGELFVDTYLHPATGEACIVYANSLRGEYSHPVNIFVSIPLSTIAEYMEGMQEASQFVMIIEDELVCSWTADGAKIADDEMRDTYRNVDEKGSDTGYYLVKVASGVDEDLTYSMLISRHTYEQKQRHIRWVFCVTLIITLFVAFKVLNILLKQMNEKQLLHERLRTQEEWMQSNALLMLMKGRKVERDKSNLPTVQSAKLALMGIKIPHAENRENQQDEILIFTVDNIFTELIKGEKYYKIDDGQHLFYLFEIGEDEALWRKECVKRAEYLNQIMKAWWKEGLFIAIGKTEESLDNLWVSYRDIMKEFEDRKLLGESVVTDIQKQQQLLSINQKIVASIRDLIEEHYEDCNLNISGIAEELGKSAKHISEVFKEETGESILYAINHKRISKAQALMRTGKYKLAEIPELTGYSNMNTFRRNFQQITGISPGKYMENQDVGE